jgi:hypothetical protein
MIDYQVTDDPRFARDKQNSAVINIDRTGYQAFKLERDREMLLQQLQHQAIYFQDEIREIRQEIKQLKQLLINEKQNG